MKKGEILIDGKNINDYNINYLRKNIGMVPQETFLFGGTIEGRPGFNPSLYIDMTIEDPDDTDDDNWAKRFLFWDEIVYYE